MRGIFNFLALVLYLNPVQNGDSAKLPCIFPGFYRDFPYVFAKILWANGGETAAEFPKTAAEFSKTAAEFSESV